MPGDTAALGHTVHRLAHNEAVNDHLHAFAALLTPEGRALLDEVRGTDPADELAVATRLRREHPAELVSAALGQARLRQRAVAKFGAEDAGRMFFTPNGVEQSTRASVA
ncbi:SAM-dependent methyltransferase, partial [Streptomyces sp. NTH33]